jgi:subtilisin family serine protease
MSWQGCVPDYHCGAVVQEADILAALDYVNTTLLGRHPVAAVNISLVVSSLQSSRAACDDAAPALRSVIAALRSNNVAVVAGAGNDAQNPATLGQIGTPACVTGAISVGATQDDDTVAPYSNTGTFLDFFAPGGTEFTPGLMIWSSIPGGGYAEKHGTSMATPHVSGSFAVLRGRSPLASVDKLQNDLVQSGHPVTDTRLSPPIVKPRINVDAALDLADTTPPTDPASFTASGSSSGAVTLTWTASTDDDAVDHYELQRRDKYNAAWSSVADATSSPYIDTGSASKMYEYSIVAVDTSGLRSNLEYDYAVNVTFTNDPVSAGTMRVYGRHMAELREATDAWREFANLTRIFTYTSETNGIRASHFVGPTGVVNALNAARSQMSLPAFAYTSVPAPGAGVAIRTQHVQELRTAAR